MQKSAPFLLAALFLVMALLASAGCLSPAGNSQGSGGTCVSSLAGTAWDLASYLGTGGTMLPPLPGTGVTVDFSADGKLAGSAGCNRYFGAYSGDRDSLSIREIGSTLMACADTRVMDQESRYIALLGSVARFRIEGDRLHLLDPSGSLILLFKRERPEAPRPLTGTTWVLESITTGTGGVSSVLAGTAIDATFSDGGKVTGSAGCNRFFADFTVTGTSLRFGPRGTTRMFCGEPPGLMEQEQRFLELLDSVDGYEISGSRLMLLDASGLTVLSFKGA